MMSPAPSLYLDNFRFRDWPALYRIAKHPQFFYRALNDRNAWVAWRAALYICKAKLGVHFSSMRRIAKAIRLQGDNQLIGCVVLIDLCKYGAGQAETGTFVAVPYQGQGIGTRARLRFVDWCLETIPELQKIETKVHPSNIASIKMLQRCGLVPTKEIAAEEKRYFDRDGRPEPRLVMSATRPEMLEALQIAREVGLYSRAIPVL